MMMNTAMIFLSAITGVSAIQILSSVPKRNSLSKKISIPNMMGLIRFGSNKSTDSESSSSSPSQAFTVPEGFTIKALGGGLESQTGQPFLQKGDQVVLDFDEEANAGQFKGCDGLKGTITKEHPKSTGVTDKDHAYFDKWYVRVEVEPNQIPDVFGGSKAQTKIVNGKTTILTSLNSYRFKKVMAEIVAQDEDSQKMATTIFAKKDGTIVVEGEIAESFVTGSQIADL